MNRQQQLQALLADPERLLARRPYVRQTKPGAEEQRDVRIGGLVRARLPRMSQTAVSEAQLLAELDPFSHKVLFDENIPSITVKCADGSFVDVQYARMPVPFQRNILDKQVLHLCSNPMAFTLSVQDPDQGQRDAFVAFRQAWEERNMEGLKTDFVRKAKSQGQAAMAFYFDAQGRVKARTLAYEDGYQICSHDDLNGERLAEAVYYQRGEARFIDVFDDRRMSRFTDSLPEGWSPQASPEQASPEQQAPAPPQALPEGWARAGAWYAMPPVEHGFSEIPVVTKRSKVAWDRVQNMIEVYEVISNIFAVCQKKYGWGILYIKGQLNAHSRKIAGYQILTDNSMDANADAKIIEPPSVASMNEYLEQLKNLIQLGSGTTFILPKDIKATGDVSGLAIQLTQELDIETARNGISQWQNCASKMTRLFLQGLASEAAAQGDPAAADLPRLRVSARFQVWRPQSDAEWNQMLATLRGAGGISQLTLIEKNTASTPDEAARIAREEDEARRLAQEAAPQDGATGAMVEEGEG